MAKKRDPWRNRIVGEAEVDPATLKGHPQNWRRHPDRQRAAMTVVLGEVGWIARIIVNRTTGRVIDGHLRLEEAFKRGEKTVPVTYVELSEAEEKEALATFDPLGALAETDSVALDKLLEGLAISDAAILDMLGSGESDPSISEVKALELRPLPRMAWYLIGVPFEHFGEVEAIIEPATHIEGAIIEGTVSDG